MRNLIVMRHAKSDWSAGVNTDFERPLNARGERDVMTMAAWLAERAPVPEIIVSSPAERTRQTALRVCSVLDLAPENIQWVNDVYEASYATLLSVIGRLPNAVRVAMLVGHNPGVEALVRFLTRGAAPVSAGGKAFPTAAVAHFQTTSEWHALDRGCADLAAWATPKSISSV